MSANSERIAPQPVLVKLFFYVYYVLCAKYERIFLSPLIKKGGTMRNLTTDFYEATQDVVHDLNKTDRLLFDYVVKNMDEVKKMSIQKFAEEQFLSTTTIFRFTQKLGFSGYTDFINCLLITSHDKPEKVTTEVVAGKGYSEDYLSNINESVRVMSPKRVEEVVEKLKLAPNIYILTDDGARCIGQYCEKLFIGLGFHAYFPENSYQLQNLVNRIGSSDIILALSFSGKDPVLIDFIERTFQTGRPYLLSITRADNNPLENLSDTNFYVFADEILVPGMDLTSHVAMLMIVELLAYNYITATNAAD